MPRTNTEKNEEKTFNNSITSMMTIIFVFLILFVIVISIFQLVGVYGIHEVLFPVIEAIDNKIDVPAPTYQDQSRIITMKISDYLYSDCYKIFEKNDKIKSLIKKLYGPNIDTFIDSINREVEIIGIKYTRENFTNVFKSYYNVGQSLPHNEPKECQADELIKPYLNNIDELETKINSLIYRQLHPEGMRDIEKRLGLSR